MIFIRCLCYNINMIITVNMATYYFDKDKRNPLICDQRYGIERKLTLIMIINYVVETLHIGRGQKYQIYITEALLWSL